MRNFCADKKSRGSVGAGGDAGAAADASGGIHGEIGVLLLDGNGVAVRGGAGRSRDEAASGDDAVERCAVYGKVFDDGEGFGAPRFEIDHATIIEVAHVKLADGSALEAAMSLAIDHEAAHAADAFAAIVVEGDGIFTLVDEGFVEDVEHFEEGHVLIDVGKVVADHAAAVLGIFLTPDVKSEFHD